MVPRLDGAPNADGPNHTTVTFDDHTGTMGGNHDLRQYVAGGAAVDRSRDPGVAAVIAQMTHDGYLGADRARTVEITVHRRE